MADILFTADGSHLRGQIESLPLNTLSRDSGLPPHRLDALERRLGWLIRWIDTPLKDAA